MINKIYYVCEKCNEIFQTEDQCDLHQQTCGQFVPIIKFQSKIFNTQHINSIKITQYNYQAQIKVNQDDTKIYMLVPQDGNSYFHQKNLKFNDVKAEYINNLIYIYTDDISEDNRNKCINKIIAYIKDNAFYKKQMIDKIIDNCNEKNIDVNVINNPRYFED